MNNTIRRIKSKASTTNPKDLVGATKVNTFLFPAIGILHGATAMMDGAKKYAPYNWRDKAVQASIYLAAIDRHVLAWREGEELASDSGVHHLGHALACCAILLDAQEHGCLIDDRPIRRDKKGKPINEQWFGKALEKLRKK